MKKEELLNKLTDKQKEYDWGSLPDSFSYSQKLSYICHKKDELDREHGIQYITLVKILRGDGCPKCYSSSIEVSLTNILNSNNIEFVQQKEFEWLRYRNPLRLDFYLPQYNIAIECQGKQHFEAVKSWGDINAFEERQIRDNIKKELCEEHNIKLIYYANYTYDFPYKVLTNEIELLKNINNEGN